VASGEWRERSSYRLRLSIVVKVRNGRGPGGAVGARSEFGREVCGIAAQIRGTVQASSSSSSIQYGKKRNCCPGSRGIRSLIDRERCWAWGGKGAKWGTKEWTAQGLSNGKVERKVGKGRKEWQLFAKKSTGERA
jgi:hypothetical protein